MQEIMKNLMFVVTISLVGQLAAASPFHPCHIQDFYGKTVEQIELGLQTPSQSQPSIQAETQELVTQTNAPWGLARISYADPHNYGQADKYVHDPSGGTDVNVYVLDTGIRVDHADFEGRAIWGTNVDNKYDGDDSGSGTHYAGTIAGSKAGVSKRATLIAVKTIGGFTPHVEAMIQGVEWTIEDHKKRVVDDGKLKGGVIMLADGKLPYSAKLVEALDAAYDSGMHIAISAGDEDSDACASAAGNTKGLVVGASTDDDHRSYSSNHGSYVDIFAPGYDILSDRPGSRHDIGRMSGTGHAAAHIAGLLAYFISAADKGDSSPDTIKKKILDMAVKDVLRGIPKDTANLLAYNGAPSL